MAGQPLLATQANSLCRFCLLLAVFLLSGCADLTKGGAYQYSFEKHFDISISRTYKYLGRIITSSDAITLTGGTPHPINYCSGYVDIEVYYTDEQGDIEEVVIIFRDNIANKCSWINAYSELEDKNLTICTDSTNRFAEKVSALARDSNKSLSGCYDGISQYGYVGKNTLYVAYFFMSKDVIAKSGMDAGDVLRERMNGAVTLLQ